MSKFVDCERDQAFLLPPDLRDWIPEDDLAHFVIEAVDRGASAVRSARLARMHGRDAIDWQELHADPRYRERAAAIGALEPAPELDLGDDAPI